MSEMVNHAAACLDKDQVLIQSGGRRMRVTRPGMADGDAGCPVQLVLGALSACILLTLKAVAENKGIRLAEPRVMVEHAPDPVGGTRFNVTLELDEHLTDRERRILYQSARICEVGKMLKGNVQIDVRLKDHEP